MKQKTTHTDITKNLQNGMYQNSYLIYVRKSTDELENQKNSILYQIQENTKFALREQLNIADITLDGFCKDGIIAEKHSAFKEDFDFTIDEHGMVQYKIDRPKFHTLINHLNNGYFKGVIILCWDRISRNKGDDAIIRKLMKQKVDFRFVLATYDKTSAGELHLDIDSMFAVHHSRVTSEKVRLNTHLQREKGICTYKAPVGYLNLGNMQNKPFDPIRAPIIKRLFEKYASEDCSLADLTQFAIDNGLTMSPQRPKRNKSAHNDYDQEADVEKIERLPSRASIHKILNNPFYCGKIKGNDGKLIKSNSHEPLIREELFAAVRTKLQKKNKCIKRTKSINYPLRGLLQCTECKRVYTPYVKKGILYMTTKCKASCSNSVKNYRSDYVVSKIDSIVQSLLIPEESLERIRTQVSTQIAILEAKRLNEFDTEVAKKRKLKEDLAYLRSNKLNFIKTGLYTPESYIDEENRLLMEISIFDFNEQISEEAMTDTMKDVEDISELLKHLVFYSQNANNHEKEQIYRILFSELSISNKTLIYEYKNSFKAIENLFVSTCAPELRISELFDSRRLIKISLKELINLNFKMKYKLPLPTLN